MKQRRSWRRRHYDVVFLKKPVEFATERWTGHGDRTAMSQRCRRYIETHHSPGRVAAAWVNVVLGLALREVERGAIAAEDTCAA
jgi:hypothetical protein